MIASTCLLIAAKFSDRKLPPLSELEKVHHGKASADEFAQLELQILQGLRWKLHVPLPHVFTEHLKALCAGAPFTPAIEDRMHFFIDLSVYGKPPLALIIDEPPPTPQRPHRCCERRVGACENRRRLDHGDRYIHRYRRCLHLPPARRVWLRRLL